MPTSKIKFGICNLILFTLIFTIPAHAQQPNEFVDLTGQLEVLHADDFQHPENSRYIFYLNVDGQRYELVSNKELPVVVSGTKANVKGRLQDGKIIVESFNVKPNAPALSQEEAAIIAAGEQENSVEPETRSFGIKWPYIIAPLALIVLFLGYLEIKRLQDHNQLTQKRALQKSGELRNYAITNLRKGYSKEQIRNALVKNNYTNQEIEGVFKGIK